MSTSINPFFGRIAASHARSGLAVQQRTISSLSARLLALHLEILDF